MAEPAAERVRFPGANGAELAGILHLPSTEPVCALLLTHCFTCSKDYRIIARLAKSLARDGFAVLRFDFTGLGESEGDFELTTLSTDVSDLKSAVDWLNRQGFGSCAVIGHSLGGTAALLAARTTPEIRALAVIATPPDTTHLYRLIPSLDLQKAREHGPIEVSIGGRRFRISAEFLEELERHALPETVGNLDRPLMVIHGTKDETVGIGEGERLFAAARQIKAFFPIRGADHLFTRPGHIELAGRVLNLWFRQVLSVE